jgi:heme/copper-type cytochrome/quinol oxidase subunit 1
MPKLTRWYLRISLVCFVLALLVGVLIAARAPLNLAFPAGAFSPIFFHLFMVGWVAQLIFGVVFWMFPKYSMERPRGSERLGWVTFWLLNLGLALRLIGEPAQALVPRPLWSWMVAASAAS